MIDDDTLQALSIRNPISNAYDSQYPTQRTKKAVCIARILTMNPRMPTAMLGDSTTDAKLLESNWLEIRFPQINA